MPVKDKRSLIKLDTNLVVTLPKGWTDYWGMKKGEKVPILYDSILVIIPNNLSNKKEIQKKLKDVLE